MADTEETFPNEAAFEAAVIKGLQQYGWEHTVLHNLTPAELEANWADILFRNNRGIDQLNDVPLSETEMQKIMEQIAQLDSPVALNGFINGGSISIQRDNPADPLHLGQDVSLSIYNRMEIAMGKSRYQIVEQPQLPTPSALSSDRRADLLLLINGMPVIHIELKNSGVPVMQAYHQIEKYASEGVYSGILSLVQVFVAMTPNETLYWANVGQGKPFLPAFAFHWGYPDNTPVNDWREVLERLLSIPMAHQLIGFYTVADKSDGVLKVMRSYQYYAAAKISDRVAKADWGGRDQLGGYVWHTTGSGKTMTSFKSAQLIAASQDADKVIFLMDRIELGKQSLAEYQNFAGDNESVQGTDNTKDLLTKLKSDERDDKLIVTSIQKMSRIEENDENAADIEAIRQKRVVFIVDEAHRSTFGDMLITIKKTLPDAMFFGFTGTPIQKENAKKDTTTAEIFGSELHRYSLADGIRDGNVLGFDPIRVMVWPDREVRERVAFYKAKAKYRDYAALRGDKKKSEIYNHYMDPQAVPMAGFTDAAGEYHCGIEDFLPHGQYDDDTYRREVVRDIRDNFEHLTHSTAARFHAIFATSSIREAIAYYQLFKELAPELDVTALFDPNIDNNEGAITKEEALKDIVADYNKRYGQHFTIPTFGRMKDDITDRLSHKGNYIGIGHIQLSKKEEAEKSPEQKKREQEDEKKQLDLLIVVDQMLTGFDSKWVNTLFLDKVLRYEQLIQAFSRTNRVFDKNLKPFGIIRYYRQPHTMERNIREAVALYSGSRPYGLFAQRLPERIRRMNAAFEEIQTIFKNAGIVDFACLPEEKTAVRKFVQQFNDLNDNLTAAKLQGFTWDELSYDFPEEPDEENRHAELLFDYHTYLVLVARYQDLAGGGGRGGNDEAAFELNPYITEQENARINQEYMETNFTQYKKAVIGGDPAIIEAARLALHKDFATLSRERQRFASILLHDIESGDVDFTNVNSFTDLLNQYMNKAKKREITRVAEELGLDLAKFTALMDSHPTADNLNDFKRFDALLNTADGKKARPFLEQWSGQKLNPFKVRVMLDKYLRQFILGKRNLHGGVPEAKSDDDARKEKSKRALIAAEESPVYGSHHGVKEAMHKRNADD